MIATLLAVVNALSLLSIIMQTRSDVTPSYPPIVRAITAGVWAIAWGWAALRRPLTLKMVAPLLTAYGMWSVLWLLIFVRSDYDRGRVAFQAAFTVLLLIPVWAAYWRRH